MRDRKFQPIIGLEIHVELKTKSKMFCFCPARHFGVKPNTHTCPVCLGLPGALPSPNKKAIEWTVMVGLALNCKVLPESKFDRKNYFYPDLPKGYQISQYDKPLCVEGRFKIEGRKIRIRRVHIEEDTGKLIHTKIKGKRVSLVDYNRSGVPLVEIVTEPDIRSSEEAKLFLQRLQQLLRYTGVSECDMEKGSMRCEPNVSVRRYTSEESRSLSRHLRGGRLKRSGSRDSSEVDYLPDYKVEIKNLNSFKFVQKAIDYEIDRQIKIFQKGGKVRQETRGWDEKKNVTLPQRGKEVAADYRYFPEPDIPPIRWRKREIEKLRNLLPELPDAKMARFIRKYALSEYDARILTSQREIADYHEKAVRAWQKVKGKWEKEDVKQIANWIINKKIDISEVLPVQLVETILKKQAPSVISRKELEKIINQVLLDNKRAIEDYKKGKTQALRFLVGQVMSRTKGQADPKLVIGLLKSKCKMTY